MKPKLLCRFHECSFPCCQGINFPQKVFNFSTAQLNLSWVEDIRSVLQIKFPFMTLNKLPNGVFLASKGFYIYRIFKLFFAFKGNFFSEFNNTVRRM